MVVKGHGGISTPESEGDRMKTMRMPAGGLALFAALTLALGCGPQGGTTPKGDTKGDTKPGAEGRGDHAAHGGGPRGGAVADWGGGQYHVEFTVDHPKQEATVYILGGDEK